VVAKPLRTMQAITVPTERRRRPRPFDVELLFGGRPLQQLRWLRQKLQLQHLLLLRSP
jgi:hypothetical protein